MIIERSFTAASPESESNQRKEVDSSLDSTVVNKSATLVDELTSEAAVTLNNSQYPGDLIDNSGPLKDTGYSVLDFPNPAIFLAFYHPDVNNGKVSLHDWQVTTHEEAASANPTSQNPYKLCLLTCNGSGKDFIMIAGWAAWFCACKIKSRVVITSSSGTQLTSQTENYIKNICQRVNDFHGTEIFRIRQRFIKCRLTGSEIRMFATDEAGRAEGYHPIEPGAEFTIIINEAKTVSEEIHGALKRCTGYNYWFEISSAGEPSGSFYKAFTTWKHVKRISAYDCPHISSSEIEEAKKELGEHSALFRSIYLALFTTVGGQVVFTQELFEKLSRITFFQTHRRSIGKRVGIDLAAGGDENCVIITEGNKCILEEAWRETDTEVSIDRIEQILNKNLIPKDHPHIYMDDGGVGRSMIDKLWRRGWKINRVLNQSSATDKKRFGNKAAENWYRVARIVEEQCFDVNSLSEKCKQQLYTRHYKSLNSSGRIFLESKAEAKAEGRPSPDRADAFILSQSGLTLDDYLKLPAGDSATAELDLRPREKFISSQDLLEHYENNVTFGNIKASEKIKLGGKRIFNSLKCALRK